MSSSISTLSRSARITMPGCFWFSLAISSSPMMEYTLLDQPRISVKPSSMTRERPLRISVEARFQAGGDGADQDADDEDAADGDDQHQQPQLPARVPGHHAGIEGAQHALPHALEEAVGMFVIGGVLPDPHHRQDQRRQRDDAERQQRQPADDGDGAPGERVLEAIAQAIAPGDCTCRHTDPSPFAGESSRESNTWRAIGRPNCSRRVCGSPRRTRTATTRRLA